MADFTKEQQDEVRRQYEQALAGMDGPIPDDVKEMMRQQLETQILSKDIQQGPAPNDYFGADKWDDAVQRYRDLGARTRGPVQLDQRQADQTRGLQMGALGTLERAAQGGAPSQAAIGGQLQGQQIQAQNTASLGAARGVGGQIAAARGAGLNMGNQLVGSLAQSTLARAGEANQDRNAFVGAAGGVRGQDIGAATTNAELIAKGRAQDEARQQGFEKMGWNTRNSQMGANVEIQRQEDAKKAELRERERAANMEDDETAKIGAKIGTGMGAGLMSFVTPSDEKTKYQLPMGALGHIGRR